jgi:hypothetical protein
MKIDSDSLQPLIMDFIKNYCSSKDLKKYIKLFELDNVDFKVITVFNQKNDPLVKLGGLAQILAFYLKNNKE